MSSALAPPPSPPPPPPPPSATLYRQLSVAPTPPLVTHLRPQSSPAIVSMPSSPPAPAMRRHPASLVPRALHDPALIDLVEQPVTPQLIAHIAQDVQRIVQCDAVEPPSARPRCPPPRTLHPSPAVPSPRSSHPFPPLHTFIAHIARVSNTPLPTLLCTLVYLNRLKSRLPAVTRRLRCTHHRLFLAGVIVATKYLHDLSPKNTCWVRYSALFSETDVNLMEVQLLLLLDYDLRIDEPELLSSCRPILAQHGEIALRVQPAARAETAEAKNEAERDSRCMAHRRHDRRSPPSQAPTRTGVDRTHHDLPTGPNRGSERSVPPPSAASSTLATPSVVPRPRHSWANLLSAFHIPRKRESVPRLRPLEPRSMAVSALAAAPPGRAGSSAIGALSSAMGNFSTATGFAIPSSAFPSLRRSMSR